jgi:hypothetical protein
VVLLAGKQVLLMLLLVPEGIIQNGSTKYGPAAQLTVTGPTSLKVSATGGGYEGTGSAESSYALAFGIGDMAVAPYTSGISLK